jgi:ferritin-like metal-binding protein YciE
LADVLLDIYNDVSGSEDVTSLKALIHDKNEMISILVVKNEELRADYEKRINHLQKQIETLEEHLAFREKQIDKKDDIITKLLSKVVD